MSTPNSILPFFQICQESSHFMALIILSLDFCNLLPCGFSCAVSSQCISYSGPWKLWFRSWQFCAQKLLRTPHGTQNKVSSSSLVLPLWCLLPLSPSLMLSRYTGLLLVCVHNTKNTPIPGSFHCFFLEQDSPREPHSLSLYLFQSV